MPIRDFSLKKLRYVLCQDVDLVPNQQCPLNKFQLSSEKSAPLLRFLELSLGQILLIVADWAHDLVPNMDKKT